MENNIQSQNKAWAYRTIFRHRIILRHRLMPGLEKKFVKIIPLVGKRFKLFSTKDREKI
jgi:hypothetical protein